MSARPTMGRPGTSYMGLTQANTSKQDESRSLAVVPMVDGPDGISHCDPHVPVGHGRGQQAGGAAELGSPPQRPDLRSGSLEVPSRAHHAAASSQAFCSRFRSHERMPGGPQSVDACYGERRIGPNRSIAVDRL